MRLQWKVFFIVTISTAIAAVLVGLVLSTSLKAKDLEEAKHDALERAILIKSSLINVMIGTDGGYQQVARTISELNLSGDIEFRMIRAKHVVRQHGMKRNEVSRDEHETRAIETGEIVNVMDNESSYRLILPFIADERCPVCHLDMNDKPIKIGTINGAAVITFNLKERERKSNEVIAYILASFVVVMILVAGLILFMTRKDIVGPVEKIVNALQGFGEEKFDVKLPAFSVNEIEIMAQTIREIADDLNDRKAKGEKELGEAKARNAEVEELILEKASAMGIDEKISTDGFVKGLSVAMDEAERGALLQEALCFHQRTDSEMVIPSDPDLIQAVAVYLSSFIGCCSERVKKSSIELALEEALANAVIHGNLEIESPKTEEEIDNMGDLIKERRSLEPYSGRKVSVAYSYNKVGAKFVITDEGPGFNSKEVVDGEESGKDRYSGRGLIILKTLTSKMEYNEKGNQLTLRFEL